MLSGMTRREAAATALTYLILGPFAFAAALLFVVMTVVLYGIGAVVYVGSGRKVL